MSDNQQTLVQEFVELQSSLLATYGASARSRFLWLEGAYLSAHILESGRGEPVLLIHGGGGLAASWAPLLARLQSHFRLIAPDRPGCGLSDKVDYRSVAFREHAVDFMKSTMDGLRIDTAAIIGNSMGGFWSIVFALAHPDRVSKLVLIGAPAGIDRWIPPMMRLLGVPVVNRLLYATVGKPSPKNTKEVFRRMLVADIDKVPAEALECAYVGSVLPGAQQSWLTMLEEFLTLRGINSKYYLREELGDIQQPTLFIWGAKDAFAPPSSGLEAVNIMLDARVEVVPEAGHLPWLDAPDRCAELIVDFLKSG